MRKTVKFELLIKISVIVVALGWLIFMTVKAITGVDPNSFGSKESALKSSIITSVFIASLLIIDPLEILLKIKDNLHNQ